ncbi:MAG: DUF2868 domain-containing protein [Usitatibacter sp.]
MREEDLRRVLLVKAIEESDRDAAIVPSADRAAAAREAMRAVPAGGVAVAAIAGLPANAPRLLAERSRPILARIAARYPFVTHVLALLDPPFALMVGLIALGLALGASLSALDGTRRINVLAFPLLGLVAWNFAVYAFLLFAALRPARATPGTLRTWVAGVGPGLASRLIARSRHFNTPLADALQAFAREWFEGARPLLVARATVLFHMAAAAVGVGLIAGLYVRGIALDYQAGWESTFLDASGAGTLLAALYGPASWMTGIAVPDVAHLESTRWRAGGGGESAARWIHLMAASALIYVVLPRLVLALAAAARTLRLQRHAPLPASLAAYFRTSFAQVDGAMAKASAIIAPYACELSPPALARLIAWLASATGGALDVHARASVPYGEEDRYVDALGAEDSQGPQIVVMPFSLASTPEDENHGKVIAAARDWIAASRPHAQLMVVIDEAPYTGRMAGSPARVAERRELWRRFVEARGLKPAFTSLES